MRSVLTGQVAANAAHVPVNTIHKLAAAYLAIRVAYSVAYVRIENGTSTSMPFLSASYC